MRKAVLSFTSWGEISFVERWAITTIEVMLRFLGEDARITTLMNMLMIDLVEKAQRGDNIEGVLEGFTAGVKLAQKLRDSGG